MTESLKCKTVLGADCRIRGELTIENDLTLMGRIEGSLHVTGTLELSAQAHAQGTLQAGTLRTLGRIEADTVVTEAVEFLPGSNFTGRLFAPRLNVAEGATIEGEIYVGSKALEKAKALLAEPPDSSPEPAKSAPYSRTASSVDLPHAPENKPGPSGPDSAPAHGSDPVRPTVTTVTESVKSALDRGHPPRIIKAAIPANA